MAAFDPAAIRYGLDFGTSNSALSVWLPKSAADSTPEVVLAPLDSGSRRPEIVPTVLYLGREGYHAIGQSAIAAYHRDNVGREAQLERVYDTDLINTYFGPEQLVSEVDVALPGRFFQALKSFLSDTGFDGTSVFGQPFSLDELIGIFLHTAKDRADRWLADTLAERGLMDEIVAAKGLSVGAVVLGRPVRWVGEDDGSVPPEEANRFAQARLRDAAVRAGFTEIHFQYEPVAAALAYEAQVAQGEEIVLVFDFGGGTLDTTLVRVHGGATQSGDRRGDILATSGRPIGGNTFDEEIMDKRLMKHFGQDIRYSDQHLALPHNIYNQIRSWYTIPLLQEKRVFDFLNEVAFAARNNPAARKQLRALDTLIRKNYGLPLFETIEAAKIALSDEWETEISMYHEAIAFTEPLSRLAFETTITYHLRQIERLIDETLAMAGIHADDVQAVLRTGGSSYIPAVQKILKQKFGFTKIRFQDAFANVASGLAVAAANGTWFD